MGHNTSFLTRVANNLIYVLNDSQFAQLKTLATSQLAQINQYGYMRYPLMKAFRCLIDADIPTGSSGLSLSAVKQVSREMYVQDGQISYDRAVLYAAIINSFDSSQKAYLDAMKGKGWSSWPDVTEVQIKTRMSGLPQGTAVAVMTYASDLFSWYVGSVEADTYFCPERQGTYFGSFYIKDAPAIGHEGYGIDEQLTASAGSALIDSSKGYVTAAQAAQMVSLVALQKNNLYAGSSNIVSVRRQISTLLRNLLTTGSDADAIKTQVLALSATYGELDGENNVHYANTFAQVNASLSSAQKTKLAALRKTIMSGKYADGTAFDYSVASTYFLYSEPISDLSVLTPYIGNTDYLFFDNAQTATVPDAPTDLTASAGSGRVTLSFTAPGNNGGSTISGYSASCSASGLTTRSASGLSSPLTVSGLTDSVTYHCTVSATNSVGSSSASAAVSVTPGGSTGVSSDEDWFFNWAEAGYPAYFSHAETTESFMSYRYRYYPSSDFYLAHETIAGGIWIASSRQGIGLTQVGSSASFFATAKAAGCHAGTTPVVTDGGGASAFSLSSTAGVDGGHLPVEYSCDGSGFSPALSWSNPPSGTREFAVLMSHIPVDGATKWNWVLYGIPASVSSVAKNSTSVGTAGAGSNDVAPTTGYQAPCSQGPGDKLYTFTVYALSGSPSLPASASEVTGAVLTQAIASITLGSATLNLSYARQ